MSDRYRNVPIRRYRGDKGNGGWRTLPDPVVEERTLRVTATGSVRGELELLSSPWGTEALVTGALFRVWGVLPWQWRFVTPPDRTAPAREPPPQWPGTPQGGTEEVTVEITGEAGVARRRAASADRFGTTPGGTRGAPDRLGSAAGGTGTGPERGVPTPDATRGVVFPGWSPETVIAVADRLTTASSVHRLTGGVHLAIYVCDGFSVVCEDISRHSAIDRLVGTLLVRRSVPWPGIVALSCRVTADLLHRATAMNIPLVASLSAPTYEAVAAAEAAGTTLCGFVREGRLNVYAGAGRLAERTGVTGGGEV